MYQPGEWYFALGSTDSHLLPHHAQCLCVSRSAGTRSTAGRGVIWCSSVFTLRGPFPNLMLPDHFGHGIREPIRFQCEIWAPFRKPFATISLNDTARSIDLVNPWLLRFLLGPLTQHQLTRPFVLSIREGKPEEGLLLWEEETGLGVLATWPCLLFVSIFNVLFWLVIYWSTRTEFVTKLMNKRNYFFH